VESGERRIGQENEGEFARGNGLRAQAEGRRVGVE